jgi:hypothetical protein
MPPARFLAEVELPLPAMIEDGATAAWPGEAAGGEEPELLPERPPSSGAASTA